MEEKTKTRAHTACAKVLKQSQRVIAIPCRNSFERRQAHLMASAFGLWHFSVEQKHTERVGGQRIIEEYAQNAKDEPAEAGAYRMFCWLALDSREQRPSTAVMVVNGANDRLLRHMIRHDLQANVNYIPLPVWRLIAEYFYTYV